MARQVGVFDFSANFELKTKSALDARTIVDDFSDLTSFTSDNFIPEGLPIVVKGTTTSSERGLYICVDEDNLGQAASWLKIGNEDGQGSGLDADFLDGLDSTDFVKVGNFDQSIDGNKDFINPLTVAPATADGHALNRITADGRYVQSADLSNYVTLDTAQTITGAKTFNSDSQFRDIRLEFADNKIEFGSVTNFISGANGNIEARTNGSFVLEYDLNNGGTDTFSLISGGAEVFRVDNSGNLGIGTTSPSAKLDVSGDIRATGDAFVNGNVGIGTTSPNQKLQVSGNAQISTILNENEGTVNAGDIFSKGNLMRCNIAGTGTVTIDSTLNIDGNFIIAYCVSGVCGIEDSLGNTIASISNGECVILAYANGWARILSGVA